MITKLFIEGQKVDLSEDILIPLNFAIDDIRNISKKSSAFSKTITVPGTSNNNKLFNFLFNIKAVGNPSRNDFDFKKKYKCIVLQDNLPAISGYAKLVNATIEDTNIQFEIQIISELTDFITTLSDKKLEDIPEQFTNEFDHVLTPDSLVNSWTTHKNNPSDKSVFYPLIDYGYHDSNNGTRFLLSDLKPALSAKVILDLIFESNGYTYESSFLNTERFKRLYVPNSNEYFKGEGKAVQITNEDDWNYQATTTGFNSPIEGDNILDKKIIDGEALFSLVNKSYTAPYSTFYNVQAALNNFNFHATFTTNDLISWQLVLTESRPATQRIYAAIAKYSSDWSSGEVLSISPFDEFTGNRIFPTKEGWTTTSSNSAERTSESFSINLEQRVWLEAGEHLTVSFYIASQKEDSKIIYQTYLKKWISGSMEINLPADGVLVSIGVSDLLDNASVLYKYFVNKGIKQIDFVSSIFRLFNLFPIPDQNKPKHFKIYDRDEYYSTGKLLDWTKKVDYSQPVTIVPIPSLDAARLNFSYTRDEKDYFLEKYFTSTGKIYGNLPIETGYEFNTQTKEVISTDNFLFAPTMPVQYSNADPITGKRSMSEQLFEVRTSDKTKIQIQGFYELQGGDMPEDSKGFLKAAKKGEILFSGEIYEITSVESPFSFTVDRALPGSDAGGYWVKNGVFSYVTDNDKVIPCIYGSDDNNVSRKAIAAKLRLLYYSGLKSCNEFNIQTSPGYPVISYQFPTEYPVLSHLDNNQDPTYDLLFSKPNYTIVR